MRALLAKDIAPFTKILAKMELKESLKATISGNQEHVEIGSELNWSIIENYHKAENEFFAFLAGLEGKDIAEISELTIPEFIDLVKELFSETNLPFFKSVAK
jgi:hypothetical protein